MIPKDCVLMGNSMNCTHYLGLLLVAIFSSSCGPGGKGINRCGTPLSYVTNMYTNGADAIKNASQYRASFLFGDQDQRVSLKVDTASANMVISAKDYEFGMGSLIGERPFYISDGTQNFVGINAKDEFDFYCRLDIPTQFTLAERNADAENILGLAFSDPERRQHEKSSPAFLPQLAKSEAIYDGFSLALCGTRGNSRLLFGGVDGRMAANLGSYIPIIERTSYVVPALSLRRSDNKSVLGKFPEYNPKSRTGTRTTIDSSSSFLLLPNEMAAKMAQEVKEDARKNGLLAGLPEGFFNTQRATPTTIYRFNDPVWIRRFPTFEITFAGHDGKVKALELSPFHYLKEMDANDSSIRVFAVRGTSGEIILGQPFLENHYTFFDRLNNRIGFGNIDVACAP